MPLTPLHADGFQAGHERMAEMLQADGTEPDYSVGSLGGLARYLAKVGGDPEAMVCEEQLLLFRAGAYAAEVLLRAVPGADVSLKDGELTLTLPSALIPGMTFEAYPRLRAAKVLRGEEVFLDWAFSLLVLTTPGGSGRKS